MYQVTVSYVTDVYRGITMSQKRLETLAKSKNYELEETWKAIRLYDSEHRLVLKAKSLDAINQNDQNKNDYIIF